MITEVISNLGSIGAFLLGIGSIGTLILSFQARREARKAHAATAEVAAKVDVVANSINGVKDQLVAATRQAGLAEGRIQGASDREVTLSATQTAADRIVEAVQENTEAVQENTEAVKAGPQ